MSLGANFSFAFATYRNACCWIHVHITSFGWKGGETKSHKKYLINSQTLFLLPSESVYVVKLWVSKDFVTLGSSTIVIQVRWLLSSRSFKNGRWFVDGTNQLCDRFTVLSFSRLITWSWSTISSPIGQSNGSTEVRKAPISSCVLGKGSRFSQQLCKNPGFHCTKNQGFYGAFQSSRPGACDLWLLWGNPWPLWVPPLCDAWEQLHPGESWCLGLVTGESGDWRLCLSTESGDYMWLSLIIDYHYHGYFCQKTWQIIGLPKGPIVVWFLLCCFALCRDGFILVVSTTLAKDRVGMLLIHYEGYN